MLASRGEVSAAQNGRRESAEASFHSRGVFCVAGSAACKLCTLYQHVRTCGHVQALRCRLAGLWVAGAEGGLLKCARLATTYSLNAQRCLCVVYNSNTTENLEREMISSSHHEPLPLEVGLGVRMSMTNTDRRGEAVGGKDAGAKRNSRVGWRCVVALYTAAKASKW